MWKKVRRGLSAGRVQSVAVRIIVDREEEIRKFKPEEYWSIDAKLLAKSSRKAFAAKLYGKDKKISIKTKEEADAILKELEGCDYVVENVKKACGKNHPRRRLPQVPCSRRLPRH